MKVEYVVITKTESAREVNLVLDEVGRPATQEEIETPAPPDMPQPTADSVFYVSSKLDLLYRKGNAEFDVVRSLPLGHRVVLEF